MAVSEDTLLCQIVNEFFLHILTNVVLVDNWLIWHEENHNEIKANPIKSKLNRTTNIFFPAARLSAGREVCLYNFFQYLYMNLFFIFFFYLSIPWLLEYKDINCMYSTSPKSTMTDIQLKVKIRCRVRIFLKNWIFCRKMSLKASEKLKLKTLKHNFRGKEIGLLCFIWKIEDRLFFFMSVYLTLR